MNYFKAGSAIGGLIFLASCSSAVKKTIPLLSRLEGKRIALVSIEGEETPKKIIEVALVNQLVQRGTFVLINKKEVEAARSAPDLSPTDWKGLASRVNADYALRAKVLQFDADIQEGYSSVQVIDTQLAEEQGTEGQTEQIFKVKKLRGTVQIQLQFTRLDTEETQTAVAEAQDQIEESAKNSSIHLPPSLRFLENLANKAFREFFDRYN